MNQVVANKRLSTEKIVMIGVLSAVSIVLGVTPLGMIPLPIANATIMHIPVILGAILGGPAVGAFVGGIFGLFSMLKNMSNPGASLLAFTFINPLVSVLPRICIGWVAYYVYAGIYRINQTKTWKNVSIAAAAALGTITNTVGVLGMIYLLYAKALAEKMGVVDNLADTTPAALLWGIVATNAIGEVIVAVILTLVLTKVLLSIKR